MPLTKYFGYVGSFLLLLLFGLDWYLPQPVSEPLRAVTDNYVIRISSVEHLPERVVIDTSLPTIVPPSPELEFAERWAEVELVEAKLVAGPRTPIANDGTPRPEKQRGPLKKVAALRPASSKKDPSTNYVRQAVGSVTRLSLLDIIKERFGRGLFKLN
jgi:hypothetical protein